MKVLEINQLEKSFGENKVLKGISLTAEKGDVVSIIGSSGSGKSTIAKGLEKEALEDQYFVDRKLYPNVDFYSGIIYRAMGIPVEMFTVMFALGRLPGWIAQWKEMRSRREPIGRPRQIYTGATLRKL